MDPQLIAALVGSSGLGGLLVLAIKRTWSDRDDVNDAFAAGRASTAAEYKEQIEQLRSEFRQQREEDNTRHRNEIEQITNHVQRLHNAIAELVPLVNPEQMPQAVRILAALSINPTETP